MLNVQGSMHKSVQYAVAQHEGYTGAKKDFSDYVTVVVLENYREEAIASREFGSNLSEEFIRERSTHDAMVAMREFRPVGFGLSAIFWSWIAPMIIKVVIDLVLEWLKTNDVHARRWKADNV